MSTIKSAAIKSILFVKWEKSYQMGYSLDKITILEY